MELAVFNIAGQQIVRLADGPAIIGAHRVLWNGRSMSGKPVGSGIFFYKLTVRDETGAVKFNKVRPMMMVK
jgi:hypothetical protein